MTRRIHPLRSILAALSLCVALCPGAGALSVSGNVDGRWTEAMGPVLLTGDCYVRAGTSLVVEPGVRVCLAPGASLLVDGALTAIGTTEKPIWIERQDATAGAWRTLSVRSAGHVIMTNCLLRGGGYSLPDEITGAVRVDGGRLELTACEVRDSSSSGVLINGGVFSAASSWFDNNGGAQPIDAGIHVITGTVALADGVFGNRITNSVFGLYNADIVPVVASGVWWGSATGPQHTSNIPGLGVSVSDDVIYDGYVTVNPFPTRGDLDRDGDVTVLDVAQLLRIVGGINAADTFAMEVGDVAPNRVIDMGDALALMRAAAGGAPLP